MTQRKINILINLAGRYCLRKNLKIRIRKSGTICEINIIIRPGFKANNNQRMKHAKRENHERIPK